MRDLPDDSPPEYDTSGCKVPHSASNSVATPTTHSIIIFGSSGSGKSSIVNLLAGSDVAATDNSAKGCTLQNSAYPISIGQHHFTLHDTASLDEGEAGCIPLDRAIAQLHDLLTDLKGAGLALLIFCVRAGRITETAGHNWRLFSEVLCQGNLPVLLAITGLETEQGEMSDWWMRGENRTILEQYGVKPTGGVVCMTAYKGKLKKGVYQFQEEYDLSVVLLREAILVGRLLMPWAPEPVEWLKTVVHETVEERCRPFESPKTVTSGRTIAGEGLKRLMSIYNVGEAEAETLLSRWLNKAISLTIVGNS